MVVDGIEISNTDQVKIVTVPDNDYLPFVKVSALLREMEVGSIMLWPLKKANTVRQTVMKLNRDTRQRYKYTTEENYIKVCRFADCED